MSRLQGWNWYKTALRIALPAGVLLLLPSCTRVADAADSRAPRPKSVLAGRARPFVRTEPAQAVASKQSHAFVARVTYDERRVARVGPPVQGRVSSIDVVTGDRVKAGSTLLTLTTPEIASARAQVSQARTQRQLAERTATRADFLMRNGAGSEVDYRQAEAMLEQANNEERRANAALGAIGGAHGACGYRLRSPISGTVIERNVSVGAEVSASAAVPLVTVADLSTVWVIADVYEQDLGGIRVGDEASVTVIAYPGRTFRGKITHVGDKVDPQTRAASARVELANPDLALRAGMFASVQVQSAGTGAARVPTSALLAHRDQFFVYVASADGAFAQREVHVGEQRGQHATILSGIAPGDMVVTEGAILLDAEANEAL